VSSKRRAGAATIRAAAEPDVRQDSLDHGALRDDGDEAHAPVAPWAAEHVPAPHAVQ